jgi:hypothetical protein
MAPGFLRVRLGMRPASARQGAAGQLHEVMGDAHAHASPRHSDAGPQRLTITPMQKGPNISLARKPPAQT